MHVASDLGTRTLHGDCAFLGLMGLLVECLGAQALKQLRIVEGARAPHRPEHARDDCDDDDPLAPALGDRQAPDPQRVVGMGTKQDAQGRLHQERPQIRVTALGDRPDAAVAPCGVFGRHQAQIRLDLVSAAESLGLIENRQEHQRSDQAHAGGPSSTGARWGGVQRVARACHRLVPVALPTWSAPAATVGIGPRAPRRTEPCETAPRSFPWRSHRASYPLHVPDRARW
jgi:hypothetical protein